MPNVSALQQGKSGEGCRGEEHIVQLIWSLKSGKTKLLWDRVDMSSILGGEPKHEVVDASWKTSSGQTVSMVAHADQKEGVRQFNLVVDGMDFSSLPTVHQLGPKADSPRAVHPMKRIADLDTRERLDSLGSGSLDQTPDDVGFRLSMAGFSQQAGPSIEVVDELHSDLYSPILESLRQLIAEVLPQLEDMVSRAIINAFYVDHAASFEGLSLSSSSSFDKEPHQVEVEALLEARKFSTDTKSGGQSDDERRLSFMQKQVDDVFIRVRNEELSSEEAARILISVASLIGLRFSNPVPRCTVIFWDLDASTTTEDLYAFLSRYGSISIAAMSARDTNFGFCRFESPASTNELLQDASRKQLSILGATPSCSLLCENRGADEHRVDRIEEKKVDDDAVRNAGPLDSMSPSSASIPHLMAPPGANYEFCMTPTRSPKKTRPDTTEHTASTASGTDSSHEDHVILSPHTVTSMI